ncbi:related to monophenol monooxygenase (tyrosinase) [Cephalotrichum gorgonifer]|uniref:Related to monophenol monooxygenase (Tyrosinase) n=1 Tax=Cephalotrichum gorgonifer TaxID=2041049 RepID=A0AAE8MUB3_9PEZI|nr:related to monophenol monooxygenase (tyrosinase) [Cephalotrichum gorgonifer]
MRAGFFTLLALQAASAVLAAPTTTEEEQLANLAQLAFDQSKAELEDQTVTKRSGTCSWSNIKIRREWGSLSSTQKKSYIAAVKCLQSKPARTPSSVAPGAKTRFDDFVATHINQTMAIHYTGNFLSWHRYYVWMYEKALQEECGYTGTQPYWDWAKTAITGLENSPIFDGSDTSLSGNGAFIPNQGDIILGASSGLPPIYLPPGSGGGCVTSGPFKDMKVNLGPAALDAPGGVVVTNPDGPLAYNPRCLSRSLTDEVNKKYSNVTAILNLLLKSKTINDFQMTMQGVPGSGNIGVHGGGHYSLGGDPGRDVYTSPGDPVFYLHHSQIDRMWWTWQMLSPSSRIYSDSAIFGTNTFMNMPPSADTTLDDIIEFGYAASPPLRIGDLLTTLDGPFCYVYL